MVERKKGLPLAHQQCYQSFQHLLGETQQAFITNNSGLALQSQTTALQQFFREQVLRLQSDELSPAVQHWVQSYHVEIDKQLRLLGVDVLFLQAARQSITTEERRQQVCDRLETLQRYCKALLEGGEG